MSPAFAAGAVLLAAVALWCFSALDRARWYSRARGRRGRRSPEFTPLCFWHRRGTAWYGRRLAEFRLPPRAARAARRVSFRYAQPPRRQACRRR